MSTLLFHTSIPVSEMDESHTHNRSPTFAALLFSCCSCVSDNERPLLRPSWFQRVRRSIPRADSVSGDSQNWWRKGWNSVRSAGESSESITDEAGSYYSGPKWKQFVRRLKRDGKINRSSKSSRFHYDPLSYELNFDHGSGRDENHHLPSSLRTLHEPYE